MIMSILTKIRRIPRLLAASAEWQGWILRLDTNISINMNGKSVDMVAFIDTGNRLCEPLSGLPVLIVKDRIWERLFPNGITPKNARNVSFYGVTGGSTMNVVKPDSIFIIENGKSYPAPDVWVGCVPNLPSSGLDGLAPAEFGIARLDMKN